VIGMLFVVVRAGLRYQFGRYLFEDGVEDLLYALCVLGVAIPDCNQDGGKADTVAGAAYVVNECCGFDDLVSLEVRLV
jgi:hypothetical protein